MKSTHQFWTLFRFQLMANPMIWFMAIAFCMPLLFQSVGHESLNFLTSSQNLVFIGFLGLVTLAPEILYTSTSGAWAGYNSEFLLTRAVDRSIMARVKCGCFCLVAMTIPLGVLIYSLKSPDLQVDSYSKIEQQECIASISGSTTLKNHYGQSNILSIPTGNRILAAWHCWQVVTCAAVVQMVTFLVYPWPYRKYILWSLYGLGIFLPLVSIWLPSTKIPSSHETLPSGEHLFFIFAAHQLIFWGETLLFVLLAQLWCERRFAQLEQ
jgi:hypothetical protein